VTCYTCDREPESYVIWLLWKPLPPSFQATCRMCPECCRRVSDALGTSTWSEKQAKALRDAGFTPVE